LRHCPALHLFFFAYQFAIFKINLSVAKRLPWHRPGIFVFLGSLKKRVDLWFVLASKISHSEECSNNSFYMSWRWIMKARFIDFGEIEIDGQRYDYDVVIDEGGIRKRKKKPSKVYRDQYGHTPLSIHEDIPWGGKRLIVGTGAYGKLPIMPEVLDEAKQHDIEIVAVSTEEACRLISNEDGKKVRALLHVTC
jgi:hypothetical protein